MAKALTKSASGRTSQYGYLPSTTWKAFVTLFRAFGTQLISEDRTKFQLNSELGMKAINHLNDFFHTYNVSPTPDQIVGSTDQMWISGVLGMYQGGTSVSVNGAGNRGQLPVMVAPNAVGPGGVDGSRF